MLEKKNFTYLEKSIPYGLSRAGHIVLCSIDWERLRTDAALFVGIPYGEFISLDGCQTVEQVLSLLESSREQARETVLSLSSPGSGGLLSPRSSQDLRTRRRLARSAETSPEEKSELIRTSSNNGFVLHSDKPPCIEHLSEKVTVAAPEGAALLRRSTSSCYSNPSVAFSQACMVAACCI
mmetsp:Transcript_10363/g.16904  ORF Transcript_10363/g.16904 Transcript_10363/m.16904 type:complete len:180 (-) Transcript_10363:507-1046(-)